MIRGVDDHLVEYAGARALRQRVALSSYICFQWSAKKLEFGILTYESAS
jgi:hypothetical protein